MWKNTQAPIALVILLVLFVVQLVSAKINVSPFVGMTTVVGSDSTTGDGLEAKHAIYQKPTFVKYSDGEVYVVDTDANRIRKISANGRVSTIVGTGESIDSGEGGLAVNAQIYGPFSLDVNSYGEVIFTDELYKVKKIFKNGTLTYLPSSGSVCVAFHPSTGEIYFCTKRNLINKIDMEGNIVTVVGSDSANYIGDGPALSVTLVNPVQIAFSSSGDLFISEGENSNRIKKLSNGQVTTIPGNGGGGLAVKPGTNDLVFADTGNHMIRLISASNGQLTTIVGTGAGGFGGDGGLATDALINQPGGISYSPNGDLYIADTGNKRIRKVSAADGTISTYSGGSIGDGYQANHFGALKIPQGVAVTSNGEVIVVETGGARIRKVSNNGILSTIASGLLSPLSIVTRPNGDIFFTDYSYIKRISAEDGKISTVVGSVNYEFTPDGALANETYIENVRGIAFNSQGELIFSEALNNRIRKVLSNGTVVTVAGIGVVGEIGGGFSGDEGLAVDAKLNVPFGLVVTPSDDIIFVDKVNWRIRIVYSNGTINTIAGNGNNGYSDDGQLATQSALALQGGIALNSRGELIFTDSNRIRKLFTNRTLTTIAGGQLASFSGDGDLALNAKLKSPMGLAIDSNDNIYIADMDNSRIRKISIICPFSYAMSGSECIPTCFGLNASNSQVCSGRGQCDNVDTCTCTSPYYGSNCELFNCNGIAKNSSQVCSGSGTCQSPNTCTCQSGYYGSNCESFNCSGISKTLSQVCSSHGTCQGPNNCSCQTGYYGVICESFNCNGVDKNSSQVCSSHGICQSPNTCTCQSGYYGTTCELFNCSGIKSTESNVCSSRGQCTAPNTCKCSGSTFGSNCEFTATTSNKINGTISQFKLNSACKSGLSTLVLIVCLFFALLVQL